MDFQTGVEVFNWESEDQKKGYLALVQYLRGFGIEPKLPIDYVAAWFIQKDHESNEYWRDMVGQQVSSLQNEIRLLQQEIGIQGEILDAAKETLAAHGIALRVLTKE